MRANKCMFLFIALLLCSFSVGFSASATVYTLDEQFSSSNTTVLRFKIENNSQDTIKDFELHYHVVQDTDKIAPPEIYYMPTGKANWVFHSDTSATLVIYFPELTLLPGETLGEESGFSIGMHNTDWNTWSKSNDPSQPSSNQFTVANNVDMIAGGKSVMLGNTKYKNCPVVQFVEVQSDTIALQVLQLLNSDTPNLSIKSLEGDLASIHLDDATVDSLGQKIWRGYVPVQDTNRGEFWAECNGNKLAYFAYGWTPKAAASAVNNNLWESSEAFVQANFDMGYNQGLRANERLVLNTDSLGKFVDARFTAHWKFYRPWEDPGEPQIPGTLYPDFGAAYEPAEDMDSLTFAWTSLEGIEWYNFLVMKDSIGGDTLVSMVVEGTGIKIPIFAEAGNYVWYADPLVEANEGEEYDFLQPSSDTPTLLRRSWYKRLKRYAKKTVKKAIQVYNPVIYSFAYDESLWKSVKTSIEYRLNPIGVLKIFAPNITLHTKRVTINKDLTYLDLSYQYLAYGFNTDWNGCKDKNHFCASKDTRILQTDWNTKCNVNQENWDQVVFKPNPKVGISTASNRCWLTMAQALNHYYGGSIPQDQIMHHVRNGYSDHGGGGPLETMQAVNYALGMNTLDAAAFTIAAQRYKAGSILFSFDGWSILSPHPATIIQNLEQGKPLGISQLNKGEGFQAHSLLIDGYKIQANGNMHVHVLNTDNWGSSEWRYYCSLGYLGVDVLAALIKEGFVHVVNAISGKKFDTDDIFFSYFTPPTFVSARATETRFFTDADGDGMMDFDEDERFGTSSTSVDTDGDGIDDKQEVLDYAACQYSESVDNLADRDGDGLDAQLDPDSDGDGYCDFQETGHIKYDISSSCNKFDPSRFPADQVPLCRNVNVAWLASDKIQMNDRAICTGQSGAFCPVASYDGLSTEEYGVHMGVSAMLGNIYSAKSVLMRNNALVIGSVETGGALVKQSSTATVLGRVNQYSSMISPLKDYYASLLMDGGNPNIDFTEKSRATLNANETKSILNFSAATKGLHLTVNSGAHLKLVPGSYALSSLHVNSGGLMEMPAIGNVELYIGKDFQWKGAFTSSNLADIAQRLKIYYVGDNTSYLDANFAAKVVAPHAKVILGQSGKDYYGSIYAKSIVIHQNTKFTWVPYKD